MTADGAGWIGRLSADLFPRSAQLVDRCHAAQQAGTLAQARFPRAPDAARRWHETLKQDLRQGESWQVIAEAQAAGLSPSYFITHWHRLDYPSYRADGWPDGSSATENEVKQHKQRLCGAGMRLALPDLAPKPECTERSLNFRAARAKQGTITIKVSRQAGARGEIAF